MKKEISKIYFSEVFEVAHSAIEKYGALDISLVCDNPAFVDPFLIFANSEYDHLHKLIINYLKYLRDLSIQSGGTLDQGTFRHYYKFPEVKQVWLGYSIDGNSGLGLGIDFASSLYRNLNRIFSKFGNEKISSSSHLEKLCLVEEGVGVDKISDFTLNLIKKYLLEYTELFAKKYINKKYLSDFAVQKVEFDFKNGLWKDDRFVLPSLEIDGKKEFVLLVPKQILTKQDTWISKNNFLDNDTAIFNTIENDELRSKINKYFTDHLRTKLNREKKIEKDYSKKSRIESIIKTAAVYPEILDYYIKYKEKEKADALKMHVASPENITFFCDVEIIQQEIRSQEFGKLNSFDDCISRITFFKKKLESNSNALHIKEMPLQEKQLQTMFKLTTYNSLFDYNSEVNNGRGPIDFIISYGSTDKTGLELKLASNTKLKQNLLNQGTVYSEDSNLKNVIKVIFFFSDKELERVTDILREINKSADNREIFLIDCRKKTSASNVK